ncbi:hypothetical protein DVH24_013980 [Malus domestica]|uniref:Uncharacterized protein n=1 Tax=Malus domestica TaxID=3750 RepID=A0A498JH82_MALDO|nr:hypothetical protein DVH24_013980 [Malus domestica]
MYVVHPDWLRPRSRGVLINCEGDREANTRCTWFTQIGYVHGVEEFLLIVKSLLKYIGSSSPLMSTSE